MSRNSRLKATRVLRDLTQLQLAEMVGKREIDISRYETGRSRPDAETRQHIAAALQKSTYELFDC